MATASSTPTATLTPTAASTSTPTPTATPTRTVTPTNTPTRTLTNTPTPSPSPTPTRTATAVPVFTLSGVVFFDYNGNGARDGNEPPISGATIKVGSLSATSGADGGYSVARVPKGKQSFKVTAHGFQYVSLSTEALQSIGSGVSLTVNGDTQRDWGLMQGFLTLPVVRGTQFSVHSFVDVGDVYDHTYMQDWMGGQKTYAGHQGIDYDIADHTVVAAAPGLIIGAEDDYQTNPALKEIGARVIVWYGNGFFTQYNDMKDIAVEPRPFDQVAFRRDPAGYVKKLNAPQRVSRGQALGHTGFLGPPLDGILHFENWTTNPEHTHGETARIIDPYRLGSAKGGIFANRLFSLWTCADEPHYP